MGASNARYPAYLGETFLTSLSLALALSAQIQLRGEYPLQFFFLDEGFGTLDQDLLDTVVTALENCSQTICLSVSSAMCRNCGRGFRKADRPSG